MPAFLHPGPEMRLGRPHGRSHGVSRSARRIDHDMSRPASPRVHAEKPSFMSMFGHVLLVGLCGRILLATRSRPVASSVYLPRGRKPLYQMSKGSSGRPRRCSISFATFGTSGEERTCIEHRLHALFRDFPVLIEPPGDQASEPWENMDRPSGRQGMSPAERRTACPVRLHCLTAAVDAGRS